MAWIYAIYPLVLDWKYMGGILCEEGIRAAHTPTKMSASEYSHDERLKRFYRRLLEINVQSLQLSRDHCLHTGRSIHVTVLRVPVVRAESRSLPSFESREWP